MSENNIQQPENPEKTDAPEESKWLDRLEAFAVGTTAGVAAGGVIAGAGALYNWATSSAKSTGAAAANTVGQVVADNVIPFATEQTAKALGRVSARKIFRR